MLLFFISLSRFGLLLASSSPLQPSDGWRHHLLRPARLRRLRERGQHGGQVLRMCLTVRERDSLPNYDVLSLDLRGDEEGG